MPELKLEYPSGVRSTEMLLVEMLTERRSWADYMKISRALSNLRLHAKSMEREREHLNPSAGSCEEQPS